MNELSTYRFIAGSEYVELPEDEEIWIIEPLVPQGGQVNIFSAPKTGKSYLGLGMALAVANGDDEWLGFPVKQAGAVLYLQADTPKNLWRARVRDLAYSGNDFSNVYFADPMTIPFPFDIFEGHGDVLKGMVDALPFKPIMIIIDTTREVHSEDENDSKVMRQVIGALRQAVGANVAIILISHPRKGGGVHQGGADGPSEGDEGDDLMTGNRGSGYVAGKMDTIIKLTRKYMHYQGRAVGRERLRVKLTHIGGELGYLWLVDQDPVIAAAVEIIKRNPTMSARGMSKLLADKGHVDEEAARSVIRRQKKVLAC